MGKELLKGMKRCSTSTDAAEASDRKKKKKTLQIAESELQSSEVDVKKQKKSKSKQIDDEDEKTSEKKEMKKLRKSFKEMTQTMKNLQDFFTSNATDSTWSSLKEILLNKSPDTSPKEEEEPPKKLETFECCFETEDYDGYHCDSLFVTGFGTSRRRDDIKSALREHFESSGCQVTKVFVPIECQTGVPLGFAFVYVDDNKKALEVVKGYMGGCHLQVTMAKYQSRCNLFPDFRGCRRCGMIIAKRRRERFIARGGRQQVWVE